MKINSLRIFAALFIILFILGSIQAGKKKTKKQTKAKKQSRIANKHARLIGEQGQGQLTSIDVNAWKRDKFLSQLKNEKKYLRTANTTNKWTLFNYVIGKTLHLLGLKDDEILKFIKRLTQPIALKLVVMLMRFQKSMNFKDLMPMLNYKIPGLTAANFLPLGRQKVLNFLNAHIRKRPTWY